MKDEFEGFMMNLDVAEEFFTRVLELKEDTLENRMKILKDLQKEMKAIKLNEKDIKRQLKNKRIGFYKGD